jgi:hypothetical protein
VIRLLACVVALAACSASYQPVKLVNRSPRVIEEIYVFPSGAANHGASRAKLLPGGSATVSVKSGNVDVLAVAAKERIDDTQSETKTATQTLELRGPLELVFHDSDQTPPDLTRKGTVGLTFRASTPPPAPPPPDDTPL